MRYFVLHITLCNHFYLTLQLAGASHLDGAVVANNPAQIALLETDLLWPARPLCCLFSVGTGRVLQHSRAGMGAGLGEAVSAAWAGLADTETTHHLLRHQLPGKEYWRLSPALQPEVNVFQSLTSYMFFVWFRRTYSV